LSNDKSEGWSKAGVIIGNYMGIWSFYRGRKFGIICHVDDF
jgi:hypothetical protein